MNIFNTNGLCLSDIKTKISNERDFLEDMIRFQGFHRIGEILDKHLGKGDIIFIDWRAPIPTDSSCTKKQECERYEGADFFCCGSPAGAPQRRGLARLGSIASARGARLVVTTGMPRRAEPKQ